jgi:transcription antitermination factor NusG
MGNKVTIKDGPFKGMSGIIVSRNDDIITVEVDLFGQDTPIELSINQL